MNQSTHHGHKHVLLCRFGRNFPMWMHLSTKDYLFTTSVECCQRWYPYNVDCVIPEDDGVQEGEFYISDAAYYPNWKGNWCAFGNDYPEWMADPTQITTHLFTSAKACCDLWFKDQSEMCQANLVIPAAASAAPFSETWYPTLNGKFECVMGTAPAWMRLDGFESWYVFYSHAECCKAHYCQDIRGVVWS